MNRLKSLLLVILLTPFLLFAETEFEGLHLNENNKLLFTAKSSSPSLGEFSTLFVSDIENDSLVQLSFFPEDVMLINNGLQLQIQNRFGVFRTDENLENMTIINDFPSFVNGKEIQSGKLTPTSTSPDGKYLIYFKNNSPAKGNLIIFDIANSKSIIVSENVDLLLSRANGLWAPDSKALVYEKNGELYYYSVEQYEENRIIAERFRKIGTGKISSVTWSKQNDLFFVHDNLVYRILNAELFTRSLYSDLLNIGDVMGKIPFRFDPNFDKFWIAPDGYKIMLNKGGQNIFVYFLNGDDYTHTETRGLPYLYLPRNTTVLDTVWSQDDEITLLTGRMEEGEYKTELYNISLKNDNQTLYFSKTDYDNVKDLVLSPNELKLAILLEDKIVVKDYLKWTDITTIEHTDPLKAIWRNNSQIVIAGRHITELIDLDSNKTQFISISQADNYGFGATNTIYMSNEEITLSLTNSELSLIDNYTANEAKVASNDYRVYLEHSPSGSYKNMIMVRLMRSYGTENLFPYPEIEYDTFPDKDEVNQAGIFNHGSRIRRREIALVFNGIDTIEGLTDILNVLREFNIRSTFFLNGDFIRRHPDAVQEIADSGHEVGSLFYAYFNMTDPRYGINKTFIKQGLARNEDDFYQTTNSELSLLWHAPHYTISTDIIEASKEMNYTYVGRDIDTLDWISPFGSYSSSALYAPSTELIERVIEKKQPGSIIPIRIGIPGQGREDYLFHYLDILINNLIKEGYELVPVSTLIEHSK